MPKDSEGSTGSSYIVDRKNRKVLIPIDVNKIEDIKELLGTVTEEVAHGKDALEGRQDKKIAEDKSNDEEGLETLGRPANEYVKKRFGEDNNSEIKLTTDGIDLSNADVGEKVGDKANEGYKLFRYDLRLGINEDSIGTRDLKFTDKPYTEKEIQETINKIDEHFGEYENKHLVEKDEKNFLVEFNKIKKDLYNTSNRLSKQLNPDKEVINYIDTKHKVLLLSLLDIYEIVHKMVTNQPNFKVSKHFNDLKNEMLKDRDKMVAEFPEFRQFELRLLNNDFQKFAQPKLLKQGNDKIVISELFLEFLKTRKDISPLERDYLLSYTLSEYDLRPNNMKNYDKIHKIIDGLTTSKVKNELKQLQIARMGEKAGNSLNLNVLKGNKNFNFKIFYFILYSSDSKK